jgi:hypothetical protein
LVDRITEGVGVCLDDVMEVEDAIGYLDEHGAVGLGAEEIQLVRFAHLPESFGRFATAAQHRDHKGGQRGGFQEQLINRRPTVRFPSGNLGMH